MIKNDLILDLSTKFGLLSSVRNLSIANDSNLLDFLLEESKFKEEYKARFFIERKNVLIFNKDAFITFLDLRIVGGSYSHYANKIGLALNHKLLKVQNEVVLNFPFKDCVLKGGQLKDTQKSEEIFFNEILAKDEIDVLLSPKALCNFELVGYESSNDKLSDSKILDESHSKSALKQMLESNRFNILIKGNNLLALASLKKKFANQVKLIYIDPPYNTGNDSFNYNDRFSHSTWLVFMKNRLEKAKEFLRDDGVIFIQCDDNEQAYLKVLCDEIFGRDNFVACMPRITKKAGKSTESIQKNNDYILMYKKLILSLSQIEVNPEDYPLKDEFFEERGGYKLSQTLDYDSLQYSKTMDYEAEVNGIKFYAGGKDKWLERQNGNFQKIDWVWRWSKEKLMFGIENGFVEIKGNRIYTKTYFGATISKQKPYTIEKIVRGKSLSSIEFIENQYSNDMASKNIQQVFNQKNLFNYSKPEALLKRIIEISTNENDLIMDFFAGSGTTIAVAHKMNRRYIGIEQMEYVESITKERLKKVVAGEQGGVSKAVGWGESSENGKKSLESKQNSFIYAELMPLNAVYKQKIINCENSKELEKIFKELEFKAFVDYRVDIKKLQQDKEFNELDFKAQKELLYRILDSNMDYVLYGDIEDRDFNVDKETIELNKAFYKE